MTDSCIKTCVWESLCFLCIKPRVWSLKNIHILYYICIFWAELGLQQVQSSTDHMWSNLPQAEQPQRPDNCYLANVRDEETLQSQCEHLTQLECMNSEQIHGWTHVLTTCYRLFCSYVSNASIWFGLNGVLQKETLPSHCRIIRWLEWLPSKCRL